VQALQRSRHAKQEELTSCSRGAVARIAQHELKRLREGTDRLRTAQAKLDAVSTALEFELEPGAKVRVAGAEVNGAERLTVVARTGIDIEGVGRITVLPGGEDLQSLIGDRDRQRDELAVLLQSLGVANLAAAEARERLHAQRVAEAKAATSVLAAHAPEGVCLPWGLRPPDCPYRKRNRTNLYEDALTRVGPVEQASSPSAKRRPG
jgi:hypothetical protein